jgi:succinate dehydrogenase/fumarate reductase flavoprotein subunit
MRGQLEGGISLSQPGRVYNLEWLEFLTLRNLVDVLEVSAGAAALRTESRGVHYRDDHPFTDDNHWLRSITAALGGETVKFGFDPVVVTRMELPAGRTPYHDYIKHLATQYA